MLAVLVLGALLSTPSGPRSSPALFRSLRQPAYWIPPTNVTNTTLAQTRIPMILHQTWKTSDLGNVSEPIQQAIMSWRNLNPEFTFHLWTDDEMLAFIDDEYPDVAKRYRRLKPGAMRADLARYLLLHRFGGVYSDVDTRCLRPITSWAQSDLGKIEQPIDAFVGIELDSSPTWEWWKALPRQIEIVQWTLASRPQHDLFLRLITKIVGLIDWIEDDQELWNYNPTELTGPGPMTDALAEWLVRHGRRHIRDFADLQTATVVDGIKVFTMTAFNVSMSLYVVLREQLTDHITWYRQPENTDQAGKGLEAETSLVQHLHMYSWEEPHPEGNSTDTSGEGGTQASS